MLLEWFQGSWHSVEVFFTEDCSCEGSRGETLLESSLFLDLLSPSSITEYRWSWWAGHLRSAHGWGKQDHPSLPQCISEVILVDAAVTKNPQVSLVITKVYQSDSQRLCAEDWAAAIMQLHHLGVSLFRVWARGEETCLPAENCHAEFLRTVSPITVSWVKINMQTNNSVR